MPKKDKRVKRSTEPQVRDMVTKNDNDASQQYALLEKALGGCKFAALCQDGQKRIAHVPGRMRNKSQFKMAAGDMVLLSVRSFQDNMADILEKYSSQDVRTLKKGGRIPESLLGQNSKTAALGEEPVNDDEIPFDFDAI